MIEIPLTMRDPREVSAEFFSRIIQLETALKTIFDTEDEWEYQSGPNQNDNAGHYACRWCHQWREDGHKEGCPRLIRLMILGQQEMHL